MGLYIKFDITFLINFLHLIYLFDKGPSFLTVKAQTLRPLYFILFLPFSYYTMNWVLHNGKRLARKSSIAPIV
jgi:hypothetical protein